MRSPASSTASRSRRRAPLGLIDGLAPEALARHWQVSAEFLKLALAAWPARLDALGLMDVGARRVALLRALAERWTEAPPDHVVVAAGSTGSQPAVADLLTVIAGLPQGAVVLPGLDLSLAESAWARGRRAASAGRPEAPADPRRPGPRRRPRLARRRRRARPLAPAADQRGAAPRRGHRRLAGADQALARRRRGPTGSTRSPRASTAFRVVYARAEEEAATAAALVLREALETPGRTAALVTPDAALARRVSARLTRWGVAAD